MYYVILRYRMRRPSGAVMPQATIFRGRPMDSAQRSSSAVQPQSGYLTLSLVGKALPDDFVLVPTAFSDSNMIVCAIYQSHSAIYVSSNT